MTKYKNKQLDEQIIKAAATENSATAAAAKVGIRYVTYRKHAMRLGVWSTNQSGKGTSKKKPDYAKILIEDILAGKHPHYQTAGVKRKLIEAGIKENKCEFCGITEWNNHNIVCQLDHINGDRNDHRLDNLRMLCPNCHSQTETFRGKNKKKEFY